MTAVAWVVGASEKVHRSSRKFLRHIYDVPGTARLQPIVGGRDAVHPQGVRGRAHRGAEGAVCQAAAAAEGVGRVGPPAERLQVLDLPGGVPGGVVPRQVGVHGAPDGGHAAALRHQPRLHRALEARLRRRAAPHPQGEPAGEPARARARLGRADHPVAGRLPPRRRAHAVVLDDRAVFRKGRRRDVRRPLWHRRGAITPACPSILATRTDRPPHHLRSRSTTSSTASCTTRKCTRRRTSTTTPRSSPRRSRARRTRCSRAWATSPTSRSPSSCRRGAAASPSPSSTSTSPSSTCSTASATATSSSSRAGRRRGRSSGCCTPARTTRSTTRSSSSTSSSSARCGTTCAARCAPGARTNGRRR